MKEAPIWLMTFPEDRPSIPAYARWIAACGARAEVLFGRQRIPRSLDRFEALLLPGGGDIEPALYGAERPHPRCSGINPVQDERELDLLHRFLAEDRPVFGICRGLQLINVAFGGELIQHIPDVVPERTERHRKSGQRDALHGVTFDLTTRMGWCLQAIDRVNSAHHQSIDPRAVGRNLRVVACSDHGVIEAIESGDPAKTIAAVQWHPERLPAQHPGSMRVRDYFVSRCRRT